MCKVTTLKKISKKIHLNPLLTITTLIMIIIPPLSWRGDRDQDKKTLPKALRTQASTALPSNLVWIGGFGLVGLAQ